MFISVPVKGINFNRIWSFKNEVIQSPMIKQHLNALLRHGAWIVICIPLVFAMPAVSSAQANDDLTQLKTLNARFINNFITNDTVSHSQIIHKNFVCITSKGKWLNRKDYLTGWASGYNPALMPYFDYRDERITLYGNTALVRAVTKFVSVKDGKETMGMTQYTDVYIKENGTWKCVQAQLTSLSPENYPDDKTIVRQYKEGKIQ